MKNLKKVLALLVAVMVIAASMSVALAEDEPTIVIQSSSSHVTLSGHTFDAYEILTGDYVGSKYVNLAWGTNMTAAAFLTAVTSNSTISGDFSNYVAGEPTPEQATEGKKQLTAPEFAAAIQGYNAAKAQALANVISAAKVGNAAVTGIIPGQTSSLHNAGYYLIVDTTNVANQNDAANKTLLYAENGSNTMTVKADIPTIDKKMKDEGGTWEVVGDTQIGDTVWYKVETSVPSLIDYDSYTYTIHDTMGAGLKLDTSSIKVYTASVVDPANPTVAETATALADSGEGAIVTKTLTGVSQDGSAQSTFDIAIVLKKADGTVTAAAADGVTKLYTYYKAVVTEDALIYNDSTSGNKNEAYLEFTNTSNGGGTGKTTEKKVYDWSFKIELDKTDGTSTISGAKFVLSKTSGLTADSFGYNAESDTITTTTNAIGLVAGTNVYTVADSDTASPVYVISAGDVNIKGLDDNTAYYLYEVKAPDGYNALTDPVTFSIAATYADDGSAVTNVTYTQDNETVSKLTVVNRQGTQLPETGGIGTTIFYVAGGILVLAAIILLVTNRRMNADE